MIDGIHVQVAPEKIDMLTKIIEAYDNLGIVSTLEPSRGRVVVRVTRDTWGEMMEILGNLPFVIDIMSAEV